MGFAELCTFMGAYFQHVSQSVSQLGQLAGRIQPAALSDSRTVRNRRLRPALSAAKYCCVPRTQSVLCLALLA